MTDIGFNYVPDNQRVPGVYPEVEGDIPGQPPQWTLMIGQSLNTASSVPVMISSVAAAVRRFGAGSMLASMVERYLGSDPNGTLWVLALNNFASETSTLGVTSANSAFTSTPAANIVNGMTVTGTGIPANAILWSINPTTGAGAFYGPVNATGALTSATVGGVINVAVTVTSGSSVIVVPAGTANGATISGTGIPTGSIAWNVHNNGNATLYGPVSYTGSTNTALPVTLGGTNGGLQATGSIDFGYQSPSEDGVLYIYIAGRMVAVPVANGSSTQTIATAVAAAINGYFDANDLGLKKKQRNFLGVSMPVTAAAVSYAIGENIAYRVTLTAIQGGYFRQRDRRPAQLLRHVRPAGNAGRHDRQRHGDERRRARSGPQRPRRRTGRHAVRLHRQSVHLDARAQRLPDADVGFDGPLVAAAQGLRPRLLGRAFRGQRHERGHPRHLAQRPPYDARRL